MNGTWLPNASNLIGLSIFKADSFARVTFCDRVVSLGTRILDQVFKNVCITSKKSIVKASMYIVPDGRVVKYKHGTE